MQEGITDSHAIDTSATAAGVALSATITRSASSCATWRRGRSSPRSRSRSRLLRCPPRPRFGAGSECSQRAGYASTSPLPGRTTYRAAAGRTSTFSCSSLAPPRRLLDGAKSCESSGGARRGTRDSHTSATTTRSSGPPSISPITPNGTGESSARAGLVADDGTAAGYRAGRFRRPMAARARLAASAPASNRTRTAPPLLEWKSYACG